jgi:hypothetical protein
MASGAISGRPGVTSIFFPEWWTSWAGGTFLGSPLIKEQELEHEQGLLLPSVAIKKTMSPKSGYRVLMVLAFPTIVVAGVSRQFGYWTMRPLGLPTLHALLVRSSIRTSCLPKISSEVIELVEVNPTITRE